SVVSGAVVPVTPPPAPATPPAAIAALLPLAVAAAGFRRMLDLRFLRLVRGLVRLLDLVRLRLRQRRDGHWRPHLGERFTAVEHEMLTVDAFVGEDGNLKPEPGFELSQVPPLLVEDV